MIVPYHKPYVPKDIGSIFGDSISDGWLTTGPIVREFESRLSEFLESDNIIAVNSCTAALHLALASKDISQSDRFIAPTYTFVSSVEIGVYFNSKPLLVDSCRDTFLLDLNKVEDLLKNDKKIKFIIPVHFAGQTVDMKSLFDLANKYGVFIVEDAAHAFESISNKGKVGNTEHIASFSFYANKNLTTAGEGGALATNDDKLANRLRKLSLHGMSKDGWNRFAKGGKWAYDISDLGYKYNMTDFSASFGINQLSHISKWYGKRIEIMNKYNSGLSNVDGIITPSHKQGEKHAWHLYIIQIKPELWKINRDEIILKLNESGIGTSVHYIPVHMHSFYKKKYGYKSNDYPNAHLLAKTVISLPLYPTLQDKQINFVINNINSLWESNKK